MHYTVVGKRITSDETGEEITLTSALEIMREFDPPLYAKFRGLSVQEFVDRFMAVHGDLDLITTAAENGMP